MWGLLLTYTPHFAHLELLSPKLTTSWRKECRNKLRSQMFYSNEYRGKRSVTKSNCRIPKKLTYNDSRSLTLGVYQLKQVSSYTREHLGENDGLYTLWIHVKEEKILQIRLQSRYVSSKIYSMWLEYTVEMVRHWYCQCKNGARTTGYCPHLASVIDIYHISVIRLRDPASKRVCSRYSTSCFWHVRWRQWWPRLKVQKSEKKLFQLLRAKVYQEQKCIIVRVVSSLPISPW